MERFPLVGFVARMVAIGAKGEQSAQRGKLLPGLGKLTLRLREFPLAALHLGVA
jgi:hypothetical protein